MGLAITITGNNFEQEVLKSPIPVLLDFWASWCGPCKMIAPFVEEIASEYEGKVKVGKINVDEENELAGQHGIASIPTLIIYKDGAVAVQKNGAAPKRDIETMFKGIL